MTNKDNGGPASDRELLEMAAKAAGYNVGAYDEDDYGDAYGLLHGDRWNPLTDDGDALRLAVTLGLIVDANHERAMSGSRFYAGHRDWVYADDGTLFSGPASIRRAIVRAAAAVGAGMAPFPTADEIRENWT